MFGIVTMAISLRKFTIIKTEVSKMTEKCEVEGCFNEAVYVCSNCHKKICSGHLHQVPRGCCGFDSNSSGWNDDERMYPLNGGE